MHPYAPYVHSNFWIKNCVGGDQPPWILLVPQSWAPFTWADCHHSQVIQLLIVAIQVHMFWGCHVSETQRTARFFRSQRAEVQGVENSIVGMCLCLGAALTSEAGDGHFGAHRFLGCRLAMQFFNVGMTQTLPGLQR